MTYSIRTFAYGSDKPILAGAVSRMQDAVDVARAKFDSGRWRCVDVIAYDRDMVIGRVALLRTDRACTQLKRGHVAYVEEVA